MDIRKLDTEALKPLTPVTPPRPAGPAGTPGGQGAPASAGDRVDISSEARARADEAGPADEVVPSGTMSAERLLELRRRIQARVHDSPEVIQTVARRILEAGDL